jgi:hypothetical protein
LKNAKKFEICATLRQVRVRSPEKREQNDYSKEFFIITTPFLSTDLEKIVPGLPHGRNWAAILPDHTIKLN